ncbi:hypothetical protein MnTg01_00619 [archaeon MnTg01]|nr:hypothetical protein MnTg01_00619 [archaeon MnTg01]
MAVPLNVTVSPGSKIDFVGRISISFDDSTVHERDFTLVPSVISAVYFPNGVSIGIKAS